MYHLYLNKKVKKFIEKQDKILKQRIKKVFDKLVENPYPDNIELDVKKLQGCVGYRLRIGKYRFIYFIDDDILVVTIENADSRGDIYK